MPQTPEDRPRPSPRPRPGVAARPSPRPRVAGSRRDREEAASANRAAQPAVVPRPRPERGGRAAAAETASARPASRPDRSARAARAAAAAEPSARRRRRPVVAVILAVLCLLTAAFGGLVLWWGSHPTYVTPTVFTATRANVQALYAFDYKNADRSIAGKLAVLTGSLRDQYSKDLKQGGIIDTYKQVSATTSYDVLDVGLQQINGAQDSATLVVFGQYVVKSVNSGSQQAPQGSECQVTPDGAQSCTQTVQVETTKVGGKWKITQLTLLTTT